MANAQEICNGWWKDRLMADGCLAEKPRFFDIADTDCSHGAICLQWEDGDIDMLVGEIDWTMVDWGTLPKAEIFVG
jgi:hypothetical protein